MLDMFHPCQDPATARVSNNPDPTAQLSNGDVQTWPGAYCSKVASSAPNVIGESMLPLKGSRILPFLRCRRMCCLGCRCKYHRSSIRLLGHVWFRGMRDAIWHMPILLMLPDTNVLRQGPAHGQTWSRSVHERIQHFLPCYIDEIISCNLESQVVYAWAKKSLCCS